MDYEVYLKWMAMTYEEFDRATTEIAVKIVYLIFLIAIFASWYIYSVIILIKARINRKTAKKWKRICKWEHRKEIEQNKYVIEKYVEEYTEKNKIDWDEYI